MAIVIMIVIGKKSFSGFNLLLITRFMPQLQLHNSRKRIFKDMPLDTIEWVS